MEYALIGLFIAGVTVFLATSFFCCVYKTEDKEKENPIKKLLNGREVYELFRHPPEIEWDETVKRLQGEGGANYLTFSRTYLQSLFQTLNFLSLQTDLDIPIIVIYVGRYKFIIDSTLMNNRITDKDVWRLWWHVIDTRGLFKDSIRKYKIVTGEPEKLQKDTFRALSLNDLTKLRMALIDQITLLSEK